MSFHNSVNIGGNTLTAVAGQVAKQEEIIYSWFVQNPAAIPTPWQLQKEMSKMGYDFLITSIRRSLSDLTKDGKLIKSDIMLREGKGMPNHTWQLNLKPIKGRKKKSSVKKPVSKTRSVPALQQISNINLFNYAQS